MTVRNQINFSDRTKLLSRTFNFCHESFRKLNVTFVRGLQGDVRYTWWQVKNEHSVHRNVALEKS